MTLIKPHPVFLELLPRYSSEACVYYQGTWAGRGEGWRSPSPAAGSQDLLLEQHLEEKRDVSQVETTIHSGRRWVNSPYESFWKPSWANIFFVIDTGRSSSPDEDRVRSFLLPNAGIFRTYVSCDLGCHSQQLTGPQYLGIGN